MLDRIQTGDVPAKPHTALRDGSGRLRYEECLTRDGFDGPFTIAYHAERPHTAAVANATHGWEIPADTDDDARPLARRHYRSQALPRRKGTACQTLCARLERASWLLRREDVNHATAGARAALAETWRLGDG